MHEKSGSFAEDQTTPKQNSAVLSRHIVARFDPADDQSASLDDKAEAFQLCRGAALACRGSVLAAEFTEFVLQALLFGHNTVNLML